MLKKALDKVMNSGYNIRTGVEVSNREEYTFNKAITDRVFTNLKFLDEALKETVELPYLIAGGAVRDGLLGLEPKDYDIFLDMSPIADLDDDERVDYIALLNYNLHERVGLQHLGGFETPWPVHNPAYKDMENNFLVYEHAFRGEQDDPMRIQENTYQLIYRKDSAEIKDNPLGFVEQGFDWPLTKAYYKDDKVFVSQQFRNCMDNRVIESDDQNTSRRIRSWYNRNNMGVVGGFKLKIEPEILTYGSLKTKGMFTTAAAIGIQANDARRVEVMDRVANVVEQRLNVREWRPEVWEDGVRNAQFGGELPPREGVIQLNEADPLDFNDDWGNNEEAEVAPAVPEM